MVGPGTLIAERYRLVRQLGQGGMGSIWEAEHVALGTSVAVKLIHPELAVDPGILDRFVREARAVAALRSRHVVQIFDYGADHGAPYMVMELLQGESLAACLKRQVVLDPLTVSRIVGDVCRAISKAHDAGIVHRDLKPENVFLTHDDERPIAKVLDFGIAKAFGKDHGPSATRTGALVGTPQYMSPEQAQGARTVDHRSDLWSIGVLTAECLVGRVPFESEGLGDLLMKICALPITPPSALGSVPDGFDDWFVRAAERDVGKRFQSAPELMRALDQVLRGATGSELESARTVHADSAALASDKAVPARSGRDALTTNGGAAAAFNLPMKRATGSILGLGLLVGALGVVAALTLTLHKPALAPGPSAVPAATAAAAAPPVSAPPPMVHAESATASAAQPLPAAPTPSPSAKPAGTPLGKPKLVEPRAKPNPPAAQSKGKPAAQADPLSYQ